MRCCLSEAITRKRAVYGTLGVAALSSLSWLSFRIYNKYMANAASLQGRVTASSLVFNQYKKLTKAVSKADWALLENKGSLELLSGELALMLELKPFGDEDWGVVFWQQFLADLPLEQLQTSGLFELLKQRRGSTKAWAKFLSCTSLEQIENRMRAAHTLKLNCFDQFGAELRLIDHHLQRILAECYRLPFDKPNPLLEFPPLLAL